MVSDTTPNDSKEIFRTLIFSQPATQAGSLNPLSPSPAIKLKICQQKIVFTMILCYNYRWVQQKYIVV